MIQIKNKMDIYSLSRTFWDYAFENPEKISPNHAAIYFFAIEHCNRLGWKQKFGFPSQMTMDAIGIKKHQTYIRYFEDLCEWGFFNLIQKSKNQYSANIISLKTAMPKNGKALDKAIIKHTAKQTQSNGQSNSSIDIPIYQDTNIPIDKDIDFKNEIFSYSDTYSKDMLEKFYLHWSEKNSKGKMKYELQPTWETKKRLSTWHSNSLKWEIKNPKLNHIDPKLESWFNSSISMIKQDLRTNKEHNDVVRQNKYDSKYLLPE
jgi:hypothetical protein